jgi:hypothetical protein
MESLDLCKGNGRQESVGNGLGVGMGCVGNRRCVARVDCRVDGEIMVSKLDILRQDRALLMHEIEEALRNNRVEILAI